MNNSVKDENGNIYNLADKLGEGGQGCVFTVRENDSVVIKALVDDKLNILQDEKKYLEYQQNVRRIIAVGEYENIAVPYVMLEKPYCGYVMLFMNGLQSIDKLMLPYLYKNKSTGKIYIHSTSKADRTISKQGSKQEFDFAYNFNGTLAKRLKCLAKLAKIMGEFEDTDVVYCDLSPNNIYISKDPKSYETWLIDLDNLRHSKDIYGPIGTPGYMAPEVSRGNPNTIYSDRYSFALVAYRFLLMKEPFLGQAQDDFCSWEDDSSDEDAFEQAVANGEIAWIWEKDDDSNRSNTGLNPYEMLNEDIVNLFERTFNADGRNNPTHRPSMWEWYDALLQASESTFESELKFSEDSFSELVTEQNNNSNNKYYYFLITFISENEPFQNSRSVKKLVVNIKHVIELSDEDGNKEYIAQPDKKIYWDSDKSVSKYYLSNYDVMNTLPKKYVKDYIVLSRQEKLFSKATEFKISAPSSKEFEVVAIEENCIVKTIKDLLKTTIYIKKRNGQIIKKITITKE